MDRFRIGYYLYHINCNFNMISEDEYIIPINEGEGLYREKGSKFISYLFPVKNVQDVEKALLGLKKLHPKARHICYAYRFSPDQNQFRINDDGEPSGSAGRPIYNQILSQEIHEVLIAVIRYFGGTKLGVTGLIRAYKTAAQEALEQCETEVTFLSTKVKLDFDYSIMGDLMNALKQTGLLIDEQIFDENPRIILKLHQSQATQDIVSLKAKLLNRDISDIEDDTNIPGLKINIL